MSTACHPARNWQTERMIHTLEDMLRSCDMKRKLMSHKKAMKTLIEGIKVQ